MMMMIIIASQEPEAYQPRESQSGRSLPNFQFGSFCCSTTHLEVFPIPAFPPYAVQTLHFMEAPTMESITRLWEASHALDVLHGGRGGSNLDEAGSSIYLGRGLAAKAATMAPKRREG